MKKGIIFLGLVVALVGVNVSAATTSGSATKSVPRLIDRLKLSYSTTLITGAVTSPLSSLQPNVDTGEEDPGAPVMMKNYVTFGYKLNGDMAVTGTLYWKHFARERQLTFQDPYVKLTHSKLYRKGNFNLYGELKLAPGITTRSSTAGRVMAITPCLIPSYDLPNSKFSLSLVTSAVFGLFTSDGAGDDLELYMGPQIDYKIKKNVSLFVLYELDSIKAKGTSLSALHGNFADLEPGVSWDITPRMNLTPLLNISTGNKVALDTTQLLVSFTYKLL